MRAFWKSSNDGVNQVSHAQWPGELLESSVAPSYDYFQVIVIFLGRLYYMLWRNEKRLYEPYPLSSSKEFQETDFPLLANPCVVILAKYCMLIACCLPSDACLTQGPGQLALENLNTGCHGEAPRRLHFFIA